MADKTGISWTSATWNPLTGCTKVSQGCKNCYAERDWRRLVHLSAYKGRAFTDVGIHPERLEQPLRWTKPRMIFVNSMSDLFHEDVPDEFIDRVFAVMGNVYCKMDTPHTFQILTKRPERIAKYLNDPDVLRRVTIAMKAMGLDLPGENSPPTWPLPNVWAGVSVEDQAVADERIPMLLQTPAAVRWISAEPLLGPIDMSAWLATNHLADIVGGPRIDWLVVGGESGPKARPMKLDWARSLREQCKEANVPLFFKQTGVWQEVPTVEDSRNIPSKDLLYVPEIDCTFRRTKGGGSDLLDDRQHQAWPA